LELSGSGGFEAYHLAQLFSWPSLAWSVGASLTEPIFNGARTHAQVVQARANYDETVANYRQTVLTALQQVEDDLLGLSALEKESAAEENAVLESKRSVSILENQYKAGTASYLNLQTVKITESADEITAMNLRIRRFVTSVSLIEALGGGWDVSQLPSKHAVSVMEGASPHAP
jgi:outer membrane protein TolC